MTLSGSADRQKTELQLLEVSKYSFFDHLLLYSLIYITEIPFVNPPMKENPSHTRIYRDFVSDLGRKWNYWHCYNCEPRQNLPARSSRTERYLKARQVNQNNAKIKIYQKRFVCLKIPENVIYRWYCSLAWSRLWCVHSDWILGIISKPLIIIKKDLQRYNWSAVHIISQQR